MDANRPHLDHIRTLGRAGQGVIAVAKPETILQYLPISCGIGSAAAACMSTTASPARCR